MHTQHCKIETAASSCPVAHRKIAELAEIAEVAEVAEVVEIAEVAEVVEIAEVAEVAVPRALVVDKRIETAAARKLVAHRKFRAHRTVVVVLLGHCYSAKAQKALGPTFGPGNPSSNQDIAAQ